MTFPHLKIKNSLPWIILAMVVLFFLSWPLLSTNSLWLWHTNSEDNNHLIVNSQPVTTPKNKNVLVFGGDIMLSRTVNAKMEKYQNYNWPFEKIASIFSEADLAIANLESPFLFTDNYQVLSGSFSFKANPQSVAGLSLSGFDVLSLANNHILNQGKKGVLDTKKVLDEAGISYSGLVENNLVIKESNGLKFAFLAYTYDDSSALIANMSNESQLQLDIESAKEKADIVIVMMHAGTEYVKTPNKQQVSFAHLAIASGADLVIGHHPHWPQIIEQYQGKTIIYSLGNLIFDQMWSLETRKGLIAKVYFDGKELTNIEYFPIIIKDYGQAELITDETVKNDFLKNLNLD